ncbi:bifunctional DNA-formamidopyrimidine glycosylase/DNA-(apurinic or apyrimidinic site) lyase [Radiobacillus deserti]|uniref:Formamidopyrimidine-DNA glycosylase n=1 Tax=Radiobacillus deserti TaxID=2594883 RepID=A0A516KG81_9BACI|nr:bifunctional DNA-formamidopyrimidine glycosylase/DNA-(apurinic or apyrimidinic site) lyase [Radiobacillus deserti]QDP40356.1 bifunctional DNA-formamidopyrimidine glycosylase/DNA-(apurinic or apyrimidinic site) lyase [Radiobacillus deserti]
MPELPEMEHYKQLLEQTIKEKTITEVKILREKSINVSVSAFEKRVVSQQVTDIERKAKHLVLHLSSGDVLLLHLMLGGWMFYGLEGPDRTVQVRLSFGHHHLHFIGLRLGYLHILTESEMVQALENLGPEPLSDNFSLDMFIEKMHRKRGKLKTALVDQQFLSGIGNRYSDEICWQAQVLPTRSVNELTKIEMTNIFGAIRTILPKAIKLGGYMNEKFMKDDRITGGYLPHFHVYKQEGEACPRCSHPIRRSEISSRKTFYCSNCQY